jgi:hypothetical protein
MISSKQIESLYTHVTTKVLPLEAVEMIIFVHWPPKAKKRVRGDCQLPVGLLGLDRGMGLAAAGERDQTWAPCQVSSCGLSYVFLS